MPLERRRLSTRLRFLDKPSARAKARLSKNGNGCSKNNNRVFVNNEVKIPGWSGGKTLTRRGAQIMTSAGYDGDNPLRLANEIDAALAKYGLGNDHRMCKAIRFFEGELRLR